MTRVLLVALAGGAGSVLRFRLERRSLVLVNVAGSFLLGLVADTDAAVVVGVGFCGGLTTFSGFAVRYRPRPALLHVGACLAAAAVGLALG